MKAGRVLVVGAGFAGAVCARELADGGCNVTVLEQRDHIGGNAHDRLDDHGVRIHPYGPHIFHTNAQRVVDWLSRFTEWRPYEHRVLASIEGKLLPIPVNRTTINRLYGLSLDESGVEQFLNSVREARDPIRTSEDVVLAGVGRDLCDKFFRNYTRKQWGLDLSQLSAAVAARIPVRTNDDDRYFTDRFQAMPQPGYTPMFERMLDHPRIKVRTRAAYRPGEGDFAHVVYTGPIDAFFDHCFGKLPYRSLRFEHEHLGSEQFQTVGTVNYPNDFDFTRITEFKHLTGQAHAATSIVREYPQDQGDPYYPIPRPENESLYQRYKELAQQRHDVTFVGRLAQYRYYNMDQVVAASLTAAGRLLGRSDE
ncbi:UDP-galactopyranose mutase [Caenimonas koreensis]|uniref:UDP-galactopyranose mutase n=1 Tax=Caenimonas koreensis DSM 17982 TaxID=1121255 RepID=A0A844BAK8_9BURK|nr:UDP-galactopyranose mutase [Caenimonas koreensis]MRD48619.1 UDP-galactopyranose mutase [Caenimonas koreensis DSM 17982]